ncbi:DJ-1/PfpI family protein [Streptacidiphilus sp. PB12-B1b]|uniref:DJ-1/PfpI family protein n=1 Tax=Streptacidiphilus sp. PB12-B1b TaxID=2705012 RepID=UPI0015F9CB8E|nr:DJ-1/PfpI family protein [Streptacidiphilus sp. PB12-B1b]QMU75686.1 DJ-1/PfpI family protein [Streptacidiphilus sp. PB12-B1b]
MRIVIPIFDGLTALDAVGPYEVLRMLPDADVVFAAAAPGPVVDGAGQLTLTAGAAFADVDSADILLVPGGPGARRGVDDPALVDWIRRIDATTAWTTSVCTGSLLLGAAGLLEGLDATTHWSAVELLEAYGARYTAERVVVQGTTVTAAGVSSGIDMALTLAGMIAGRTVAEAIQLAIEYDPQPPFDSGSYAKAPQEVRDYVAARR